jgi:hypothetical protein
MTTFSGSGALLALRRFTAEKKPAESRCDLCSGVLGDRHEHLLSPADRRLICACKACAFLFPGGVGARYQSVITRVEAMPTVHFDESDWGELGVPVRFVFLCASRFHARVFATYPNPGGATEAQVREHAWQHLVDRYPAIAEIEPDVEGLLIDGLAPDGGAYRVSMDVFHGVVGRLRNQGGSPRAAWHAVKAQLESAGGGHA